MIVTPFVPPLKCWPTLLYNPRGQRHFKLGGYWGFPKMQMLNQMVGSQGMNMMLQPLAVPLIVTEQTYVTQQQVSLLLSEQAMSLSGDDFKSILYIK